MSGAANVRSIEVMRGFKAALLRFAEDAQSALDSLRQEVLREMEWVEHQQPVYWKQQEQRAFGQISTARANLELCRSRKMGTFRPSCIEEQVALQKAKERLEVVQEKHDLVRRWVIRLQRDSDEFRASLMQMEHYLHSDYRRTLAWMDRMLDSLDAYLTMESPVPDLAPESAPPES